MKNLLLEVTQVLASQDGADDLIDGARVAELAEGGHDRPQNLLVWRNQRWLHGVTPTRRTAGVSTDTLVDPKVIASWRGCSLPARAARPEDAIPPACTVRTLQACGPTLPAARPPGAAQPVGT